MTRFRIANDAEIQSSRYVDASEHTTRRQDLEKDE